jgi:hypothetical protein
MNISDNVIGASSFIYGQGSELMTFPYRLSYYNNEEQSGARHVYRAFTMKAARALLFASMCACHCFVYNIHRTFKGI